MYIHDLSGLHLGFFCSSAFWYLPNKLQSPEHIRKFPYSPLFTPIQLAQAVHHCHDTVPVATSTVVVQHGANSEVAGTAVSLQGVSPGPVPQGGPSVTSVCGADRRPLRGFSPWWGLTKASPGGCAMVFMTDSWSLWLLVERRWHQVVDGQACSSPIFWQNPKQHQGCCMGVAALDSWCISFISGSIFVSAAFVILTVVCIPWGGPFGKGISLCCWNNLRPYG